MRSAEVVMTTMSWMKRGKVEWRTGSTEDGIWGVAEVGGEAKGRGMGQIHTQMPCCPESAALASNNWALKQWLSTVRSDPLRDPEISVAGRSWYSERKEGSGGGRITRDTSVEYSKGRYHLKELKLYAYVSPVKSKTYFYCGTIYKFQEVLLQSSY